MRPQVLASCSNCWFNGLQHGAIGLSFGYCSEHRVVLRRPDETTCASHMRKDLLIQAAKAFNDQHRKTFSQPDCVQSMTDGKVVSNGEFIEQSTAFIRHDKVADIAADYGEYDTKIESLAQLRALNTFRSELAMLSLGRAYTDRCVRRGGRWTSGIHLVWWTRRKLLEPRTAEPDPRDLRYATCGSLDRQIELASWSLQMSRLVFLSDIGVHAQSSSDGVEKLQSIADQAATDTEIPSNNRLTKWIKKVGLPLIEEVLPESRYRSLAAELHQPSEL